MQAPPKRVQHFQRSLRTSSMPTGGTSGLQHEPNSGPSEPNRRQTNARHEGANVDQAVTCADEVFRPARSRHLRRRAPGCDSSAETGMNSIETKAACRTTSTTPRKPKRLRTPSARRFPGSLRSYALRNSLFPAQPENRRHAARVNCSEALPARI